MKPGPYVIDVHQLATDGFNGFVGADGEEPAGGIFKWDTQDDGTPFDSSTLYAFSYDTVPAQYPATQVNLTEDDLAIYDTMVQNHWDKYIEARANFVASRQVSGRTDRERSSSRSPAASTTDRRARTRRRRRCTSCSAGTTRRRASTASTRSTATWTKRTSRTAACSRTPTAPRSRRSRFTPITCSGTSSSKKARRCAWTTSRRGRARTPTRRRSISARSPTKPLATTFGDGTPLPDRAPYLDNPTGTFTSDQTNPSQVTLDLNGVPASNISGLSAFMAFSAQSQTHLNANGLCYIVGQNASDPFYHP